MNTPATAHAAVSAEPPAIPLTKIEGAVRRQYAIDGDYSPLVSERDQNYRLTSAAGPEYVVKVSSAAEPAIVSAFQIAALLHLEHSQCRRVPRIIRTRDGLTSGAIEHAARQYALRVVSYVDGEPLASVRIDADLARDLGAGLAELGVALQEFSHAGERPDLLWDPQRAAELVELLKHIDDADIRRSVSRVLRDFEIRVAPQLCTLRCQVIHGDANPGNVLIEPQTRRVTGFIDFGDMLRAPLVCDVAIAAAYLRSGQGDPLELIAPFVAAYSSIRALDAHEIGLLFDLVRARLATTIAILHWRTAVRREDDLYRQKTLAEEADAIHFLTALDKVGRAAFSERLAEEARL